VPIARGRLERVKDTFMPERVPASAGQLRPRIDNPDRGALVKLPFVCSASGLPFTVTLGKDRLGEKFHVKPGARRSVFSSDPTSRRRNSQHLRPHSRSARYRLDRLSVLSLRRRSLCGDRYDWYRCGVCKSCICGRKVETIHGGGEKAYCPVCAQWSMIGNNGMTGIDAQSFVAERREPASDATAAPRGLRSRLIGLLKS
jgi:hypothetical protein